MVRQLRGHPLDAPRSLQRCRASRWDRLDGPRRYGRRRAPAVLGAGSAPRMVYRQGDRGPPGDGAPRNEELPMPARHIVLLLLSLLALAGCSPADLANAVTPRGGFEVRRDVVYGAEPRQALDLYIPDETRPDAPLVVFFYGGNWSSGAKGDYLFLAQALTAQGPSGGGSGLPTLPAGPLPRLRRGRRGGGGARARRPRADRGAPAARRAHGPLRGGRRSRRSWRSTSAIFARPASGPARSWQG